MQRTECFLIQSLLRIHSTTYRLRGCSFHSLPCVCCIECVYFWAFDDELYCNDDTIAAGNNKTFAWDFSYDLMLMVNLNAQCCMLIFMNFDKLLCIFLNRNSADSIKMNNKCWNYSYLTHQDLSQEKYLQLTWLW